ncbi:MAG: hypothetical protein NWE89_17455, partial [Candidatus Bathyarchaeota archaeon]|nr:hypothetical protein [Candidatus Bathyarchaeota archaeon]
WESQYQAAYCSLCVTKVVGNDWWALPLSPAANTLTLDLVGGGLTGGCWQGFLPSGEVWCGVVYTVQNMTGPDVHLKCMSGGEAGCEGYSLWGNTSGHKPEDTYFAVDGQYIDEVNCKATLAPGATNGPTVNRHQNGQEAGAGFFFQASGTAHVEIVFEYLIFEGVEPPCE